MNHGPSFNTVRLRYFEHAGFDAETTSAIPGQSLQFKNGATHGMLVTDERQRSMSALVN
jgi:hypothetical protein